MAGERPPSPDAMLKSSMLGKTNVFLVGPMGSGKTAVGRYLARLLDLTFHDSDAEIERRTGVDIPFIFEKEGEPGFRQREREAIEVLTAMDRIVLATGGEPFCCPRTGSGWRIGAVWCTWRPRWRSRWIRVKQGHRRPAAEQCRHEHESFRSFSPSVHLFTARSPMSLSPLTAVRFAVWRRIFCVSCIPGQCVERYT